MRISCSRIHMLAMEEDGVASFVVLLRMGIAAMGMREYEKKHPEVAPLDVHEIQCTAVALASLPVGGDRAWRERGGDPSHRIHSL